MQQTTHTGMAPIAVIGMSLRVPGAHTLAQFWQNLRDGVESITVYNDAELAAAGVAQAALQDPYYVKAFGALQGLEQFDAGFFELTAREAELMDPQHRLFLECGWEVLEHAGYDPTRYDGSIGVFAGAGINSYLINHVLTNPQALDTLGGWAVVMSNDKDFIPTRLSYKLNLTGPSMAVGTGCSASLVAISMACQSLLSFQADMIIAGGITIQLPQNQGYWYHSGGILSPDGHCRAFDVKAAGTLDGNGIGLVLLKRLDDALADGDTIHAVIRGFAVNNDGANKVGFTAPSVAGQTAVVSEALEIAGLSAETLSYVEAHGTATDLGDPIEVNALTEAFRETTAQVGFCGLGSVKTNLGHLDTAAGVAGLIKTVLALQHQAIPPSLHFTAPNPKLKLPDSPFYVNAELRPWTRTEQPRRAGVSSLGIGGTNAHVILEEAPTLAATTAARPWQLLLLSAKTATALDTATEQLADYLANHPEMPLADIAYTLAVGRQAFAQRRIVICQTHQDAEQALRTRNPHRVFSQVAEQTDRSVAFMLPGMGAEYRNMATELYQQEPLFRTSVDACAALLRERHDMDLFAVLGKTASPMPVDTKYSMPYTHAPVALFVVSYALGQFWQRCGIHPQAMLGYSGGEYAAACLTKAVSLVDMLRIMMTSGQAMQALPVGALLAIPLPAQTIQQYVLQDPRLALAAINGPQQCIVAGDEGAIAALAAQLQRDDIHCHRVPGARAFHSQLAAPLSEALLPAFQSTPLKPPTLRWVSGVTGQWVTDAQATDPHYYAYRIGMEPVRFAESIKQLFTQPAHVLLEVGPGQVLSPLVLQHPEHPSTQTVLASMPDPRAPQSELAGLLTTLGKLWLAGVTIDWQGFYHTETRRRVPLPTYPFERQSYWLEPSTRALAEGIAAQTETVTKNPNIGDWFYLPTWQRSYPATSKGLTAGHWLVLLDTLGLGETLASQLEAQGHTVTRVTANEGFGIQGQGRYCLAWANPADYLALLQDLANQPPLQGIIHLGLVTETTGVSDTQLLDQGFYSLLFLAQALGKQVAADALQLVVIGNGLYEVIGTEPLLPAKATALGTVKVIPQEYSHIRCVNIDIELPTATESGRDWSELAQHLLAPLGSDAAARTLAYRGRHCWQPHFVPTPLAVPAPTDAATAMPTTFRMQGVYLITGGLGNIGLLLAKYLAQHYRAKLVLVGRSPLPAEADWSTWLATHPMTDATSQKLQKLQALKALGAEILLAQINVADAAALQQVIQQTEQTFGHLNGVFHAAGITGDASIRPIMDTDRAYCEQHFAGKLYGTVALARALDSLQHPQQLACVVLYSSLSPILGGLGFAAYAASNAVLDNVAFVQNRRCSRPRWLTINWDGWTLTDLADPSRVGASLEKLAILPDEGLQALEMGLSHAHFPQLVVSTGDLPARITQWVEAAGGLETATNNQTTPSQHSRPPIMTEYVAPRDETEQQMVEIWQRILGVSPVGLYDNFFELGGNSLLITQLVAHIRKAFHVEVSLTQLFNQPRVADTAAQIKALRATRFSATVYEAGEREEGEI